MANKRGSQPEKTSKESYEDLNKMLLENFIILQRVMTNMTIKFDKLSDNLSKLLSLFEMSAKSFMEKQPVADAEKDREFLDKMNSLLEQNKTIAKGLTLMEEKFRERVYGRTEPMNQMPQSMPANQQMQNPLSNIKKLPKF